SREDVLFTGLAVPGTTLDQVVSLDALAGDRFLVAVAPTATGAADVAVHVFVTDTGKVFPSDCQLAATFDSGDATGISNLCGPTGFVYNNDMTGMVIAPKLGAGPFAEQRQAADIAANTYYTGGDIIDASHDVTIQMWVRLDAIVPTYAGFAFSTFDLDNGGGGVGGFFCSKGVPPPGVPRTAPHPVPFPRRRAPGQPP